MRRNIAAHHAIGLAERAFDNVHAMHDIFALCDASTLITIHTNGMHLIEIGERIKLVCQIAYRLNRADIAIHGVDALKCDDFRTIRIVILHQGPQMLDIIVPEHAIISL